MGYNYVVLKAPGRAIVSWSTLDFALGLLFHFLYSLNMCLFAVWLYLCPIAFTGFCFCSARSLVGFLPRRNIAVWSPKAVLLVVC